MVQSLDTVVHLYVLIVMSCDIMSCDIVSCDIDSCDIVSSDVMQYINFATGKPTRHQCH